MDKFCSNTWEIWKVVALAVNQSVYTLVVLIEVVYQGSDHARLA